MRTGIVIHDSLLTAEADCPLRGMVAHRLGIRRASRSTGYRRGVLGHDFLRAYFTRGLSREALDLDIAKLTDSHPLVQVVHKAHERAGWLMLDETYSDAMHAAAGAAAIIDTWPDIEVASIDGKPAIEGKHEARIDAIIGALDITGPRADILRRHCTGGLAKYDALVLRGSSVEMVDWKFKGSAPDDYSASLAPTLPDPQVSWYAFILDLCGIRVDYGGQVQVHAEAPQRPLAPDQIPRNADGLPSRRHGYTTAANFLAALDRPVETLPDRGGIRAKYAEHIANLEAADATIDRTPKVVIRASYINRQAAYALCRERVEMFADHLIFGLARRNLRVYPSSPCVSNGTGRGRFQCEAQAVCHLVSGGATVADAIDTVVADGSHRNVYEEREESNDE